MENAIYTGVVTHSRKLPKNHTFSYDISLFCLNVEDVAEIFNSYRFVSNESFNVISFNNKNYLKNYSGSIKESIKKIANDNNIKNWDGKVYLVSQLSHFGYCYNPVSFYYCYKDNEIDFIVAEIHNTPWGERYCYFIKCDSSQNTNIFVKDKNFHISPFLPMNINYVWQFNNVSDKLKINMQCIKNSELLLNVKLDMSKNELNQANINSYILKGMLQTHKNHFRIYYQALILWLKKIPFFEHPKYSK